MAKCKILIGKILRNCWKFVKFVNIFPVKILCHTVLNAEAEIFIINMIRCSLCQWFLLAQSQLAILHSSCANVHAVEICNSRSLIICLLYMAVKQSMVCINQNIISINLHQSFMIINCDCRRGHHHTNCQLVINT